MTLAKVVLFFLNFFGSYNKGAWVCRNYYKLQQHKETATFNKLKGRWQHKRLTMSAVVPQCRAVSSGEWRACIMASLTLCMRVAANKATIMACAYICISWQRESGDTLTHAEYTTALAVFYKSSKGVGRQGSPLHHRRTTATSLCIIVLHYEGEV